MVGVVEIYNFHSNFIAECRVMQEQGYESYQDISAHADCKLIEDAGFWDGYYEVYNETCVEGKELREEYGRKCVWGGEYFLYSIVSVGAGAILIGVFFILLYAIFKNKEDKNE